MQDRKDWREVSYHRLQPPSEEVQVYACDAPATATNGTHAGLSHLYRLEGFDTASNPSDPFTERHGEPAAHATVLFQQGPAREHGRNGVTEVALLAILIDRFRAHQASPYACQENAMTLGYLEEALRLQSARTLERMRRQVEGTSKA